MSDAEINELADSQFGDPSQIHESRLLAGASDHCNGAQAALRGFKNKAKAAKKVEEMNDEVWQTMDTEERSPFYSVGVCLCECVCVRACVTLMVGTIRMVASTPPSPPHPTPPPPPMRLIH